MRTLPGFRAVLVGGVPAACLTAFFLPSGGVFDVGFGRGQAARREAFLRQMFREPLPARLGLDAFPCSGLQDLHIDVSLRTNATEGNALLEALKQADPQPLDDRDLQANQRRMQAVTYPTFERIEVQPSAQRPMHRRNITITVPDEGSKETVPKIPLFQR
jgi:hypothetical protein